MSFNGDINANTKVPLFAALATLPFLVAGALWLSSVDQKASAAIEQTKGLWELVNDIRERVIRIEQYQKDHAK